MQSVVMKELPQSMAYAAAMGDEPDDGNAVGGGRNGVPLAPLRTPQPRRREGTHPDRISEHAEHGNPVVVCARRLRRHAAVSRPQGRPIPRRGQDDPRSEGRPPKGTGNP